MPSASDRLQRLHDAGVSIWLDFIERTILRNGDLARRIREDAQPGMPSNPTIFEKALAEGSAYDDQIRTASGDFTAMELFELISTTDVRDACDIFRGVYDREGAKDGFVSIEVSPAAAHDLLATVTEAARSVAKPRSPTRSSPIASSRRNSHRLAGRSSRRRALPCSASCGRARVPRTPPIATSCMSSNSLDRTP